MGNSQTAPSAVGSESGYKMYWTEMERQPAGEIPPYRPTEISYLKSLFDELDTKKQKYIDVSDFDNYYALKEHPLYERIRDLFREETEKMKIKKITFDIMLYLLSVFHIETEVEAKYRYLFRLYDVDKDFKLNANDLENIFEILFYGSMYNENTYKMMAEETLSQHGTGGNIKLEQFVGFIPEDQVRELMTMRFIEL